MKRKIISIILLGISCLSLNGCEKVEAYKLKIEEIKKEDDQEIPVLNMGDEVILDHYDGGKYSLTFSGVKKTDKRNEFASKDIQDVFIIDYKFENYSVNQAITINEGVDFKIFNNKKQELSTYPLMQSLKYPTPSSPGGISSGSIAVGSNDILDNIFIVIYNQDNPIGYIDVAIDS